jgi:hypothetical protein
VRQRSVSPKGGLRENKRVSWPKIMTEELQNAWYSKVDKIRRNALAPPPKRIFLPAARIVVQLQGVI